MPAEQILVVDDAPINLKFTELLLAHAGYRVRTAADGEQALAAMDAFTPDLVVTDLMMPGVDGLELTRRIKADPRTRDTVVVALTASAVDQQRASDAGCDGYLNKHTDSSAITARIREFLNGRTEAGQGGESGEPAVLPGQDLAELRGPFLAEGLQRAQALLDAANDGADRQQIAESVYRWAGSAGMLGCDRISGLARGVESLLREPLLRPGELRAHLGGLVTAFAESMGKEPPVPRHICAALAGKRVGLVGLTAEAADRFSSVLAAVEARPVTFDPAEEPGSHAIEECAVVVVQVRPETWNSPWCRRAPAGLAGCRRLFAGTRSDLKTLGRLLHEKADDFVAEPFRNEEVLMRLARVLERKQAVAAAVLQPPSAPAAKPASVAAPAEVSAGAFPVDIVVAEADAAVAALVRKALHNHGMTCRLADNGPDTLRLIRECRPKAAVLDIKMPGMDGFDTLAAIRAVGSDLPVILLAEREQADSALRGFRQGADDYMVKPFHPLELAARLKRLVQRCR